MKKPIREILDLIIQTLPEGGQWCSEEKAATLASMVFGLRPVTIVEIGVWLGGSFVPMALALNNLEGEGRKIYGVDPWSPSASAAGQTDVNAKWWGNQDHENIFHRFMGRLHDLELGEVSVIQRTTSTDAPFPPTTIDILHLDGNHSEQAYSDIVRYEPRIAPGGIVILDDIGWTGGHVLKAFQYLQARGFRNLFDLAPGTVLQRCSWRAP
jgi:predicted O-methyltransferase YrrM